MHFGATLFRQTKNAVTESPTTHGPSGVVTGSDSRSSLLVIHGLPITAAVSEVLALLELNLLDERDRIIQQHLWLQKELDNIGAG